MPNENEQVRTLLALAGVTKTNYITVPVLANASKGIKLGNGGCKAVVLRLNQYARNTVTDTFGATKACFYIGDANRQEFEVLGGINSQVIFCNDLSEIWVRVPAAVTALGDVNIQVMIYE